MEIFFFKAKGQTGSVCPGTHWLDSIKVVSSRQSSCTSFLDTSTVLYLSTLYHVIRPDDRQFGGTKMNGKYHYSYVNAKEGMLLSGRV